MSVARAANFFAAKKFAACGNQNIIRSEKFASREIIRLVEIRLKSPGYNVSEKMKRRSIVNRSVEKQRVWPSGLRRCSRKQKVEGSIPVRY